MFQLWAGYSVAQSNPSLWAAWLKLEQEDRFCRLQARQAGRNLSRPPRSAPLCLHRRVGSKSWPPFALIEYSILSLGPSIRARSRAGWRRLGVAGAPTITSGAKRGRQQDREREREKEKARINRSPLQPSAPSGSTWPRSVAAGRVVRDCWEQF
mgnify:CR=1 FL=1